jgi:hypothetical protein
VRSPTPPNHPRSTSRTSITETSRNPIYRTPTSHDMDGSDIGSDQPPQRDTPSGPITGNQVVPCSWQKSARGGPMLVASDTSALSRARSAQVSRGCATCRRNTFTWWRSIRISAVVDACDRVRSAIQALS